MSNDEQQSSQDGPRFVFLTDLPPLARNAATCHGIAAHFIRIMGRRFACVLTHRFRRQIKPEQIAADFAPTPFLFYPDAGGFALKRISQGLTDVVDCFLCLFAIPKVRRFVRREKPDRIFALAGASAWFLVIAYIFKKATGLPLDIYLVDDLRDSAKLQKRWFLPHFVGNLEGFVLRRCARVLTISQGYAEHLHDLYGVDPEWLPTPILMDKLEYSPYVAKPGSPEVRTILFVGGSNDLYLLSLVDLYEVIQEWNRGDRPFELKLRILSLTYPQNLVDLLANTDDLEVELKVQPESLQRQARESWVTFLPYSFAPQMKTMVSTSFSWKLNDSYRSGRPILVYGPAYASIPRYFIEAGLPLCATSRDDLVKTIEQVDAADEPALIDRYREVWHRHHSADAVIRNLGGGDAG